MRYDDGFVAYLNGVEVARRNAPDTLAFDAAATVDRDDLAAEVPETIHLSHALGLLQSGINVLAIHGLNSSPTDASFLVLPELTASIVWPNQIRFFAEPTPGDINSAPSMGIVERVDGQPCGRFLHGAHFGLARPRPRLTRRFATRSTAARPPQRMVSSTPRRSSCQARRRCGHRHS